MRVSLIMPIYEVDNAALLPLTPILSKTLTLISACHTRDTIPQSYNTHGPPNMYHWYLSFDHEHE